MERPKFDWGETQKFFNARFNREFENTLLDTFRPDNAKRCVDALGNVGWVVGYHNEENVPWSWVIRDIDNALIGVQECNLRVDNKDFKRCYPAKRNK
jgi:hypothetical protein